MEITEPKTQASPAFRVSAGQGVGQSTWLGAGAVERRSELVATGASQLAALSFACSSGVLAVSAANTASIRGQPWAELLFWGGLVLIFVPTAFRLFSTDASDSERAGLVVMLTLALYLVKIVHSPVAFTFPDEFIHLRNLNNILETGRLFETNSILPATPLYPGLEIVTSALATLGHLPAFEAGLMVIGVARVVLALSLFLLYRKLSGSARVAGIGVLVYAANSNFLYWSAQFSYESLSLPLAVMVLYALLLREGSNRFLGFGLSVVSLLALLAIVITHHLTTYTVAALLWALAALYGIFFGRSKNNPWLFALAATLAAVTWYVLVASTTAQYLIPVFQHALEGVVDFASDPSSGRQLFQSTSGSVSPLWERAVGIASVVLILAILPIGLLRIWRQFRRIPLALALAAMSLVYPALLLLRFTSTSWEISNRASEFLFLGLAFVAALPLAASAIPTQWAGLSALPVLRPASVAVTTVLFLGGVIVGWPPNGRLSQPYEISVGTQLLEPQGVTAANWARTSLGTDNRIATDYANGRLLLSYGEQYPLTGGARGINEMLDATRVDRGILEILRENRIQYVLLDKRLIGGDPVQSIYFSREADSGTEKYHSPEVADKFEVQKGVDLLFDSGDLLIYDVGVLSHAAPAR